MKDCLNKLPEEIKDLIYLISDIACKDNTAVYLVGGFVRDLILGVKNLDLDIVVEGDGIGFAQKLAVEFNVKLVSHKRFGTATIMARPHLKIDISSARKEYYPQPAHLPVVSAGALKDDLYRRDFTVNAMAISIGVKDFGRLIDFFGGRRDLLNKKIRILHNISFIDDPTRILRAVRFEKRYNFNIEPKTLKALKESVRKNMLCKVEPQRLRDELILILKELHPLDQIKRAWKLTGLDFISSRLSAFDKKTCCLLERVEKEISWFKNNYHHRRHLDDWLVYFMCLTSSLSIDDVRASCEKFVFRAGEEKRVLIYKKIRTKFIFSLSKEKIKPSKIFASLEPLSYEVILLLKAKYANKFFQKHIEDFLEIYNGARISISGHDLHALGAVPGPDYKKIFSRVLNAKLDGSVKTREEELELVKKLLRTRIHTDKKTD